MFRFNTKLLQLEELFFEKLDVSNQTKLAYQHKHVYQTYKEKKLSCDMHFIFFRNRIDNLVLTNVISQVKKNKKIYYFLDIAL